MRAWRALGWIALIAVALFVLHVLRSVVISIIVGVFITALLLPPARWLRSRGVNRALSTAAVFLGGLLLAGAVITLLLPPTVNSASTLNASLTRALNDLNNLAAQIGIDLTALVRQAQDYLAEQGKSLATGALLGVRTAVEIVVGTLLALVLAVYFVHGGDRLFRWLVELAPVAARPRLHESGAVIFGVIGRYIRGVALVGLFNGFFVGLALWILGVPLALPLAVLTALGAFLPIVGAFVAGGLAAVVAFVAKGWLVALIVVVVTVIVQQIEGQLLAPQIYGRALDLPGAVILVSIAVGTLVAGVMGAFLAAPVAAVVVALLRTRDVTEGGSPAPAHA
ncbi:AI-2E family transporter [Nonomuraea lactucae]|uniref:AI-2E family transporter n=1 Tax=Nonomuraea lactucae TaxID=2249762 RepID=UPI000DE3B056|nr:AI-2E family transporter [Nonomuraea lactucae]